MEKRSQSEPDLSRQITNSKFSRSQKINRSLRIKGETNFQLTDTFIFDRNNLKNAKLEIIDNENDDEIPPPYASLSKTLKKFKSETDLKSIGINEISWENFKIKNKHKKKRSSSLLKQGSNITLVERLISSIFSISCIFPKKINFTQNHHQNVPYSDLELKEYLGSGAQGSVHKATFKNKEVAVKIVKSIEDAEIQHLMKLDHKNLVRFTGTCIDEEKKFYGIVMEFCSKKSLYEFLNNQNLVKPSKIVEMAKQITEGMNYLHEKKIIHRDLKSPNILLGDNDTLKITDFGACKDISDEGTEKSFKGTVYWMAPELIRNENYSEKVDIYSFGVVFWELLTCEKPYNGLDSKSVMFGVGKNLIRLQIPNFVPDGIKILLIQCFGKSKNRPSFKNIIKHLNIFCQNEDISQLDYEFEENKTAWKEDVRRTCRNFFNNVDPYELQTQIDKKKNELKWLEDQKLAALTEIESKNEECKILFLRLQTISVEFDEREKNIIYREKKLHIRPKKRIIKPLLKQLFKNELGKIGIVHLFPKTKNTHSDNFLDTQDSIFKNIDIMYYMKKYPRFKVTKNYGLNFIRCIKPIIKYNLDSKVLLSILNKFQLHEYNRLHFLIFKGRKIKKLSRNLSFLFKKKFKERIKCFFNFKDEKVFSELYRTR